MHPASTGQELKANVIIFPKLLIFASKHFLVGFLLASNIDICLNDGLKMCGTLKTAIKNL